MPKSSYLGLFDPAEEKLHALLLGSGSFVIGRSETADLTVLDATPHPVSPEACIDDTLQTVDLQQRRSVRMARRRSRRGLI